MPRRNRGAKPPETKRKDSSESWEAKLLKEMQKEKERSSKTMAAQYVPKGRKKTN